MPRGTLWIKCIVALVSQLLSLVTVHLSRARLCIDAICREKCWVGLDTRGPGAARVGDCGWIPCVLNEPYLEALLCTRSLRRQPFATHGYAEPPAGSFRERGCHDQGR